jgi:hypothetical protein
MFTQAAIEIFDNLDKETRASLVSFCCAGSSCRLGDAEGMTFFQFVQGNPLEDKVVVWLRLGRDEVYVNNPEPPSNDVAHWRVLEELRFK